MKKVLHLVSNAHIDPVWQWEKEEGIGAVITTFGSAATILEENENFIFNHNEAVLYMWVEKYAPSLFERIKKLVAKGQWKITGGWYIQPDCNMPSGESIVRQIVKGRNYFMDKFGVSTDVAVNYDSFGHSDGLVQIMADAGYIGYICVRPPAQLECRDSIWKGFNGSEIMFHHATDGYNSLLGQVDKKLPFYFEKLKNVDTELMLWGVGNHGGGPSRQDLQYLNEVIAENKDIEIKHSTNEAYFHALDKSKLKVKSTPLNFFMQGCYTSQIRVKQKHVQLENELYLTEKMLAHAEYNGLQADRNLLKSAEEKLLFSEFHDILPGSSIKEAEESALMMMDMALENLKELKTSAFFNLCSGQPVAKKGEFPIFVYNAHPYAVTEDVTVEMMLADQNWSQDTIYLPRIEYQGKDIPCQLVKESSNIPLDWRKRIVFKATLQPMTMHRFSCYMDLQLKQEKIRITEYSVDTERLHFAINEKTGFVKSYQVDHVEYLNDDAFRIDIIKGSVDPWGFYFSTYKELVGSFKLASIQEVNTICNLGETMTSPINVIENGALRTVIQVFYTYENSYAIMDYIIPKQGTEVKVNLRLMNLEKDKVLKLKIPTRITNGEYLGKTCYGVNHLPTDGTEVVSIEWSMLEGNGKAVSVLHYGNYGSSCENGEMGITLINSACYTAHPIDDRKLIRDDGYTDRIDIGERNFEFVLNASDNESRQANIDYECLSHMQKSVVLNYFPIGVGEKPSTYLTLDNTKIMLSALKKAEKSDQFVLRLFNTQDHSETVVVKSEAMNIHAELSLNGYEFKTYMVDAGKLIPVSILEK